MNADQLRQKLIYANKRVAFAWAKYYEEVNQQLHADHAHYIVYNNVAAADDVAIPAHIKDEMRAMATALKKKWECPVCMDFIEDANLEITNCGHYYCKPCLAEWKATEKARGEAKWKCGMCNRKHKFKEDDAE
jgi:hypothetical protein